jgi:hypothetical protein
MADPQLAFGVLKDSFTRAADRCGASICETDYIFAGQVARFRIVGTDLFGQIHQPFAHLKVDKEPLRTQKLTVELWDQRYTGVICQIGSMQENCLASSPMYQVSADGRFVFKQTLHSTICLDRKNRHMVGCMSGAAMISLYERGRPLHGPLNLWHNDQDSPVIHAGLISREGHGVLVAGSSGAGKSTSTLTCVDAGFGYLSEDLVALQVSSVGSFLGHSIYNSAHLEAHHLTRFPSLVPFAIKGRSPMEHKFLVLLSQVYPERLRRVAEIRAVALPRVVQAVKSRIRPASKAETLLALAPSSLLVPQLSPGMQGFQKLVSLVEQVPSYWLELGPELSEIPGCVAELIESATGA